MISLFCHISRGRIWIIYKFVLAENPGKKKKKKYVQIIYIVTSRREIVSSAWIRQKIAVHRILCDLPCIGDIGIDYASSCLINSLSYCYMKRRESNKQSHKISICVVFFWLFFGESAALVGVATFASKSSKQWRSVDLLAWLWDLNYSGGENIKYSKTVTSSFPLAIRARCPL